MGGLARRVVPRTLWALMLALFALGVMSVVWMAFIAVLIAVEKIAPWRPPVTYGHGRAAPGPRCPGARRAGRGAGADDPGVQDMPMMVM